MIEHKGQRAWHGAEPHRLTVSSGGYLTGTELDSRPGPGLGRRTRGGKWARGCVLLWNTAGCLFRCLSLLLDLPSNAVTAQWQHLSLCRPDSKWEQHFRNQSALHYINTLCKQCNQWHKSYMSLVLHSVWMQWSIPSVFRSIRAPPLWNGLPEVIRLTESVTSFKSLLKTHFL